jgi:spermidine/putrescine transport system permease protein
MSKQNLSWKICRIFFILSNYLFLWIPLIVLFVFSFNAESFPSPWSQFSCKWYIELLHATHLWKAFINSLIIATIATTLSLLMGTFLIFFAASAKPQKKQKKNLHSNNKTSHYLSFFYTNLVIPETVLGVSLLGFFALVAIPLGFITLIVAHTVLGLGIVVPMVYNRFLELDSRLTEASLVLGASPLQTFFKITIPILSPSLITSGILVFIISFDDFIVTYFCAGSSIQTLSLYILSMIRSGISPVLNALSSLLLLISSIMVFIYFHLSNRGKTVL